MRAFIYAGRATPTRLLGKQKNVIRVLTSEQYVERKKVPKRRCKKKHRELSVSWGALKRARTVHRFLYEYERAFVDLLLRCV